jgi:hypothetical protein
VPGAQLQLKNAQCFFAVPSHELPREVAGCFQPKISIQIHLIESAAENL